MRSWDSIHQHFLNYRMDYSALTMILMKIIWIVCSWWLWIESLTYHSDCSWINGDGKCSVGKSRRNSGMRDGGNYERNIRKSLLQWAELQVALMLEGYCRSLNPLISWREYSNVGAKRLSYNVSNSFSEISWGTFYSSRFTKHCARK